MFRAFGHAVDVPAQGQGTMNNLTLGNERFTYYETIGGGQGACPDADGPSGVHVTMSNTLNTPVEALELAYPLRVERYGLLPGSGGAGEHSGGNGVVRELRVLEDCRLSLISERRRHAPQGEEGGAPGRRAATWSTGRRSRPRRPATCARATSSRSRPRAAAAEEGRLFRMGEVVAIYIGPERQLPQPVERVEAHAGKGLAGNRYYWADGAAPAGNSLTLIAEEAWTRFTRRAGSS